MKTRLLFATLLLLCVAPAAATLSRVHHTPPAVQPVPAAPAATIRHVRPTATGSADCSSWAHACALQTALTGASSGDEVWVSAGIYTPTVPSGRNATFQLAGGVAIYGGFAASETARSQRDWLANVTVLSGDLDGNDLTDLNGVVTTTDHISGTNAYHVVSSSGVTDTAVLDGLTITAGDADGRSGGGMYSFSSSPQLANLTFSGNSAYGAGGGLYNESGTPTLTNVTFSGNTAQGGGGGGMSNYQCSPQLTNVTFSGNSAPTYGGGGMFNEDSSSPQLNDVTFSGNSGDRGGGMHNYSGSNPTLVSVTFSSNYATMGGGMYNTEGSDPLLANVTFSGNSASSYGGGMNNHDASNPTLADVIFSGNIAARGGGMYNTLSSNPTLANVTFSGNSASSYGGGIANTSVSTATLANCILWGNTPQQIYNVGGSTAIVTYSDVQGSWSGTGNDDADPLFVRDPDPGSDSTWGTPDDDYGDLQLQPGSPAIDVGSNSVLPSDFADLDGDGNTSEPLPLDIDGRPRVCSSTVDMGAYEHMPTVYLPLVLRGY